MSGWNREEGRRQVIMGVPLNLRTRLNDGLRLVGRRRSEIRAEGKAGNERNGGSCKQNAGKS